MAAAQPAAGAQAVVLPADLEGKLRGLGLTPDQLRQIYVTGADGKLVPLSTFATLKTTTEPRELKRLT